MRTTKVKVKVEQNPEELVERPVLATAIKAISFHMGRLLNQGLNERAIVCLVADSSNVGKPDIRAVLSSLKHLAQEYCK
jgi:hypothetical protein